MGIPCGCPYISKARRSLIEHSLLYTDRSIEIDCFSLRRVIEGVHKRVTIAGFCLTKASQFLTVVDYDAHFIPMCFSCFPAMLLFTVTIQVLFLLSPPAAAEWGIWAGIYTGRFFGGAERGTRAAQAPPPLIPSAPAPTQRWACQAASRKNLPVSNGRGHPASRQGACRPLGTPC